MFSEVIEKFNWRQVEDKITTATLQSVERALSKKTQLNMDDFVALISPAAAPYLEAMAKKSRELTLKRFGKAMQLYLPLYLSNCCTNFCAYCGFNHNNPLTRKTLTASEILSEIEAIKKLGSFEHILLVTGESPKYAGFEYLRSAVKLCHEHFSSVSIEVQPLSIEEYAILAQDGVSAVYVYQETYRKETYKLHHPKGKKSIYEYRLQCPDRIGIAGVRKIGIGALLGLENWRADSFFTALHLHYLQNTYWKTRFSIAFPRLRPYNAPPIEMQDKSSRIKNDMNVNGENIALQTAEERNSANNDGGKGRDDLSEVVKPARKEEGAYKNTPSDRELVQLMCAYRLFSPDVEISLSTRESTNFRDRAMMLGLTTMSAGSRTDPGGYSLLQNELPQWEINDSRTPAEVVSAIIKNGYDPVWKDWDCALES